MNRQQKIGLVLLPLISVVVLLISGYISDSLAQSHPLNLADGAYYGKGKGFLDDICLEMDASEGKITAIRITSHKDTPGLADDALELLIEKVITHQSFSIDVVAGATKTSSGFITALYNAQEAGPQSYNTTNTPEAEASLGESSAYKKAQLTLMDGTYQGRGEGFFGDLLVEIKIEQGKMKNVEVLEHQDTPDIANGAISHLINCILEQQNLDIDVVSGATYTSEGFIHALLDALQSQITIAQTD